MSHFENGNHPRTQRYKETVHEKYTKMMEAHIKVIKSDWSDKTEPFTEKVYVGKDGYGQLGFYFLDDVHNVRVWVILKEEKR